MTWIPAGVHLAAGRPVRRQPVADAGPVITAQQPREVAGHRVLRPIAPGMLLGFDAAEERLVVLRVSPAGDPRMTTRLAALERARGEHVVAVLDYAADDDTETLVLERLPRGDLAALLARPAGVIGGEAVTIIAPIAATLARMHAAGVAHGSLDAAHVRFRDDGAPVLTGFGAARLFTAGAPEVVLETIAEVAADRRALAQLAAAVLGAVTGPRARAARALAGELGGMDPAGIAGELARRVFEVAAATPIRWEVPSEPVEAGGGARLIPLSEPVAE
ncbi:MAG TPA: hypothetical protein VN759_08320, partial [Pseudolysinimonas sp.]|nr:hypothetical protein [Pseudolysinimonas sp.]